MRKTETETLAKAMDVLAREIQSGDGVANAAIAEAAERLREQEIEIRKLERAHGALKVIHTWAMFEHGVHKKGHLLNPAQVAELCEKTIRAAAMPNVES